MSSVPELNNSSCVIMDSPNVTWNWVDVSSTMDSADDGPGSKGSSSETTYDYTAYRVWTIIALCGMCIVLLMAVLSPIIFKDCTSILRRQMKGTGGRTLFAFFIVASLVFAASVILWNVIIFDDGYRSKDSVENTLKSRFLYDSGKWSMSMFFVLRLYFIFNDSVLRVQTWKLAVLVILYTATWCLCCWGTLGVLWELAERSTDRSAVQYSIIAVLDTIVTVYYFRRFLTVVMMQVKVQEEPSETASSSMVDSTESGHAVVCTAQHPPTPKIKVTVDQNLVNNITKSTLLNLIGVLSSCVVIAYMLYLSAAGTSAISSTMGATLRSLDAAVNTLCIFLVFGFSSKYYDFGCKYCHRGLRKCVKKIPKTIVRRRKRTENLQRESQLANI